MPVVSRPVSTRLEQAHRHRQTDSLLLSVATARSGDDAARSAPVRAGDHMVDKSTKQPTGSIAMELSVSCQYSNLAACALADACRAIWLCCCRDAPARLIISHRWPSSVAIRRTGLGRGVGSSCRRGKYRISACAICSARLRRTRRRLVDLSLG